MKHVRALLDEPPLLAQYRAQYPDEDLRPASEATASWETFKAEKSAYHELIEKLAEAQQGLCIYCEQRLVDPRGSAIPLDYQIEHVLAKSGAVGRVLDWHNLTLACGGGTFPHHADATRYTTATNASCGQTKGDRDLPNRCDPRTFPLLHALVEVDICGTLITNGQHCSAAGIAQTAVESAIELLNLNCERLRKARQDSRDNVNSWFVPLLEALLDTAYLDTAQCLQMLHLFFAGRLQPDPSGYLRAWWSTERCALGSDAEIWISKNQRLFQWSRPSNAAQSTTV